MNSLQPRSAKLPKLSSSINSFEQLTTRNIPGLVVLGEMYNTKKIRPKTTSSYLTKSINDINLFKDVKPTSANKASRVNLDESFRIACSNNDIKLVKYYLIKHKIDPNKIIMCPNSLNSPLHYSAGLGRLKMCKLLLEYKADPNGTNRLLQSPLHLAIKEDRFDCAKLLLSYSANPYLFDIKNRLPHDYSVHSTSEIKRMILEMEINPEVTNIHLSSLHYMSSIGKFEFIKYLLHRGANPNKLNKTGCTALHLSMFNGHIECSNLLVAHGASTNSLGTVNLSPLDFYFNHILFTLATSSNKADIAAYNDLEKSYINEIINKLQNGWKFSSTETILLLLNRSVADISNGTRLESDSSFISDSDLISSTESITDADKKLDNEYKKIKLFTHLIGSLFKNKRSLIRHCFILTSTQNNKLKTDDVVSNLLTQTISLILNYLNKLLKLNYEKFQSNSTYSVTAASSNDSQKSHLIEKMRILFFSFVQILIKSGEISTCRSFICKICSNWFYKNYTENVLMNKVESIIQNNNNNNNHSNEADCLSFLYFEDMFNELTNLLSQPSNLKDLCRISMRLNMKNYPEDLEMYDSILPKSLQRFLRYDS